MKWVLNYLSLEINYKNDFTLLKPKAIRNRRRATYQ